MYITNFILLKRARAPCERKRSVQCSTHDVASAGLRRFLPLLDRIWLCNLVAVLSTLPNDALPVVECESPSEILEVTSSASSLPPRYSYCRSLVKR